LSVKRADELIVDQFVSDELHSLVVSRQKLKRLWFSHSSVGLP